MQGCRHKSSNKIQLLLKHHNKGSDSRWFKFFCPLLIIYIVKLHLSGPHISGLFTYPDTCLGNKYDYIQRSLTSPDYSLIRPHVWEPIIIVYIEIDSLIRIFSYPDSKLGNGGIRISEGPLYRESDSFIRIFSYPDSELGNGCVRISEGSLNMLYISVRCHKIHVHHS